MRKCSLVLFFCGSLLLVGNVAEAQYLVPGVGVEALIVIGEHKAGTRSGDWNPAGEGLEYRIDEAGRVVLIRCNDSRYVTDRNVRIGLPETDVIRWYGAARERERIPGGALYGYLGISFAVRSGRVVVIYIFPRYLL
jgi:hypothetical protein